MYGAILGDIIGSPYEFDRGDKTKEFELLGNRSGFTDDSVMTVAVAEALLKAGTEAEASVIRQNIVKSMREWGRRYPYAGYGVRFNSWLAQENPMPYDSYGNGSAMRVSAAGWLYDSLERTREAARATADVTHNHPEGIKGAMATADAIFLCRYYFGGYCGDYEMPINDNPSECKRRIREHIEREYGYDLSQPLDEIRPSYRFNETCQNTVPQAIIAFLESTDFEDAIRNAISLGGDSDTLAAITGSIAEAAYGIPDWIKDKAYSYLDEPLKDVLRRWKQYIAPVRRANQT